MRVLGIDTAAPVVGVAGWVDGELVAAEELRVSMGADAWLTPAVGRVLARLGGLDVVAVAAGPGAFTGVRVGVATALGLALARGVPVRAFSSLGARALLVPADAGDGGPPEVIAALDARRGRAYAGRFHRGTGWAPLLEEGDLPPGDALAGPPAWVVGEGAIAFADAARAAGHQPLPEPARSPLPAAWPLVLRTPDLDAGAVQIRYLRLPDVERSAD